MENICKNCNHYFSPKTENYEFGNGGGAVNVPYGYCGASVSLAYWTGLYESSQAMKPGFFGGQNVVVSETFGCVNFKFKTDGKQAHSKTQTGRHV